MLNHLVLVTVFSLTTCANVDLFKKELKEALDCDFIKKYFKFHLFVNPHPICALEDEHCTLDNNCCGGFECKMAVDHLGVRYTCQPSVRDNTTSDATEDMTGEEDVKWTIAADHDDSDDSTNSLLREIYRNRLERAQQKERNLLEDQRYLIQELQMPLDLDEMRELQQTRKLEDYRREKELNELREWKMKKDLEETKNMERKLYMEKIAKERVNKVLKEEEHQKQEMFKKLQKAVNDDLLKQRD